MTNKSQPHFKEMSTTIAEELIRRLKAAPPPDRPELDVTGVDIGFVNLSLCRLRICAGKPTVVWWVLIDLLGLEQRIARAACANIPRCLRPFEVCFSDCPLIAIEQQPSFNGPMKNVAHGLLTYFHTVTSLEPSCQVIMSAAVNKLKMFPKTTSDIEPTVVDENQTDDAAYEERKEDAIEATSNLLEEWIQDLTILLEEKPAELERLQFYKSWFDSLVKKDDAADSLLHAYYALHKQTTEPRRNENSGNRLAKLNIQQLQAQLKEFGLPISGTKAVLKARLRKAKSAASGKTSQTLTELRSELETLGLDTTGTKKELVLRLFQAQTEQRLLKKSKPKKTAQVKPRDRSPTRQPPNNSN